MYNYDDDTAIYRCNMCLENVISTLENDSKIIFEWFCQSPENITVARSLTGGKFVKQWKFGGRFVKIEIWRKVWINISTIKIGTNYWKKLSYAIKSECIGKTCQVICLTILVYPLIFNMPFKTLDIMPITTCCKCNAISFLFQ